MSNLSDLLPAGGGAKVITATASGNLATGQTVILQSDGTVKGITSTAESLGDAQTVTADSLEANAVTHDSTNNRLVRVTRNGSSSDTGYAYVSTVSGSTISSGTGVQFETGTTQDLAIDFDSTNNKVLIVYRDAGDSNKGKAVVGTVDPSDNSISFGSIAEFESGGTNNPKVAFSTTAGKHLIVYVDTGDSFKGKAVVATISGTSVSFGSIVEFEAGESEKPNIAYDSTADKFVIAYKDSTNSSYGTAIVGTISGTSVSFGTAVVFESATTSEQGITYDSTNDKSVIFYKDGGNSNYSTAIVGTVSGTSISFGTAVVYDDTGESGDNLPTFDTSTGKTVTQYSAGSNIKYIVGTVSGTTISFESAVTLSGFLSGQTGVTYDSTAEKVIFAYRGTSSPYGLYRTLQVASTDSTNFAGITNQAINNSASGEVVVEGGVITNGSLLPQTFTPSVGSEAVFQSSATYYTASVYDPDSGKTIIAWKGTSDYGYAVVATPASDNSITYGTPVAFNSAGSNYIDITYDTGQDKALITFTDASGSNKVRAVVGTVSGTSISFGSVLEVETNASDYPAVAYSPDSANSMVVYRDNGNSNYGTARVLTISGTSVSASSKVTFESANSTLIDIVYDTGSDKFVVSYSDGGNSNYGTAIVGSVSGTTPSFGTPTVFSSNTQYDINSAYDSANDKTVMFFKDNNTPTAMVGTVSGTSISFGSEVVVASQSNSDFYAMTFDSTANKIIVAYRDEDATPDDGVYFLGTVSGTSISFGSKQIFNDASTKSTSLSYNAGVDRTVIAYRDLGNSSYGTGIVLKITSANPNLAIGSTYYVQDDGTLSTTSSSVTAGKAIANTTLLLKG